MRKTTCTIYVVAAFAWASGCNRKQPEPPPPPPALPPPPVDPRTAPPPDIELIGMTKQPPAPAAPADVKEPPRNAKKTKSGLAYRVLKQGTGKQHPKPENLVQVHYTGWTSDGKMFDSSVVRGQPAEFPLAGVIKGWTEGVQLMVVGESTRFWIPAGLAYGDTPMRPGAPAGMLVFDIELLAIK